MLAAANSMAGFYKIDRRERARVGGDGATWLVWCQIKAWTAWRDHSKEFGKVWRIVRAGQCLTTQRAIAAATDLSRDIVRARLASLAGKGLIELRPGRDATLIEIKGATGLSADHHPTSEKIPQASPQVIHSKQNPGALDPQTFQANTTNVVQAITREKSPREKNRRAPITLVTMRVNPPTSWGGVSKKEASGCSKASESDAPKHPPDEALDLLAYAEERLRRVLSGREAAAFIDQWAAAPWLTAADLRQEIDFIAGHPIARAETKSVVRVFHGPKVRAHYARVDRAIRLAQREEPNYETTAAILPLRRR